MKMKVLFFYFILTILDNQRSPFDQLIIMILPFLVTRHGWTINLCQLLTTCAFLKVNQGKFLFSHFFFLFVLDWDGKGERPFHISFHFLTSWSLSICFCNYFVVTRGQPLYWVVHEVDSTRFWGLTYHATFFAFYAITMVRLYSQICKCF